MPTPTKFTAPVRTQILKALQVGASRETAARSAMIDPATFRRWMDQGRKAKSDTGFKRFHDQVLEAEAHPKLRALGIVYSAWEDKPDLAWKFIERREQGFAPPMPNATAPTAAPVIIQLSLSEGQPLLTHRTTIDVSEPRAQDEAATARRDTPSLPPA